MDRETDVQMMRRALQLAACGYGAVSPNPMVGAVITDAQGRILGEGYHRQWGGPHAEVNAVRSAERATGGRQALRGAVIYVTLEPCSHYGKTPPCAALLRECGFRRVVVACPDPFREVSGRGIAMMREAGIEVETGLLRRESEALNRRFVYAHTHGRPYVLLKLARTADNRMAGPAGEPIAISSPLTRVLMHRERAGADAIMAGAGAIAADNPELTCRLWPSRRLRPVALDRSGRIPRDARIMANPETIVLRGRMELPELLDTLYADYGVTSLMVEGGATLAGAFVREGLWQEARVETAPFSAPGGKSWRELPEGIEIPEERADGRVIRRCFAPETVRQFPGVALRGTEP